MKTYHYTPQECGLKEFPSGEFRLEGEEAAPDQAEVFVSPAILRHFNKIDTLPYFKGNEARHVFMNIAEDVALWFNQPSLFIRCDATKEIKSHDPNTLGWPWPVKDLCRPPEPFQYDVVFQGWDSTELTNLVCDSVQQSGLSSHISINHFFYGYHCDDPEFNHYRVSFLDTLSQGRLSLVPRSIKEGVVRYRFYEAMSMGRVPVHFCDGVVLPFQDRIDYGRCSIHIPEQKASQAGDILKHWLAYHSDDEIVAMGRYGRECWEKWLDCRKWKSLLSLVVQEHFNGHQPTTALPRL